MQTIAKNLLDSLTKQARKGFYYDAFLRFEKRLVREKILSLVSSGMVLNVGCGPYGTERCLFPQTFSVYGIDVDGDSVRALSEKCLYQGLMQGSITALPLASNSIDVVYLRLVLHHLIAPRYLLDRGLSECFRVLKRGGVLALVEPNSWHPIGAMMNISHKLGIDSFIHGTDDDIALSPVALRRKLAANATRPSTYVVSYNWQRLPIPLQRLVNGSQRAFESFSERIPYFGHTLMMTAIKH